MNADFKIFDVGIQKALNIQTFSCNWIGKLIIVIKHTTTKKQHKFDDSLKQLVFYVSTFYFCCLF